MDLFQLHFTQCPNLKVVISKILGKILLFSQVLIAVYFINPNFFPVSSHFLYFLVYFYFLISIFLNVFCFHMQMICCHLINVIRLTFCL